MLPVIAKLNSNNRRYKGVPFKRGNCFAPVEPIMAGATQCGTALKSRSW